MVSDSLRPRAQKYLDTLSKPFMGLRPNTISAISFVLALAAGYFYYLTGYFLLLAFVALLFSSILDAVDGTVARKRGLQSKKGDLVDHFLDRVSDIAVITGMTLSIFGSLTVGFFALEGVMLTSYMGTQSQALNLKRDYSGLLGRSDRLILMLIFTLIQFFLPLHITIYGFTLTPTIILLAIFAVVGNLTAVYRFRKAYKQL